MKTLRMKKTTPGVNTIIIFFSIVFILQATVCVVPVFFAFINALKTQSEYVDSILTFPTLWKFNNFGRVFEDFVVMGDFYYVDMLFNSLWMLVVKVFVNVASSMLLAYGIAKFEFPGKNFLYAVVIFANTIPIIGAGPAAFKLKVTLNMVNNPSTVWLAWAGGFDFAFIVFYGTFKGISNEYSEAAFIDGANNLYVMFGIVLPQAMPSIVAIAITQATGIWNDYSTSMIYMRDYPTLAYGLYLYGQAGAESSYIEDAMPLYYAAALISALPVVLLYACNQKLILTNMTAGGLKG